MKLGTNDIGSVYLGTNEISKVYLGTNLVWESAFDADYQSVLDYATTQGYTLPSVSQQALQNQLVINLKAAGVWSKLDTFAVFATDGDSDFGLIDWIRLSQYTAVNSPTFITNVGFQGNASSSYINTNYNPTLGTNFLQNDAAIGIYTYDNPYKVNQFVYGNIISSNRISGNWNNAGTANYFRLNDNNSSFPVNRISNNGLITINRTSGTNVEVYNGNSLFETSSVSSSGLPNGDIYILATNSTSGSILYAENKISMYFMSSEISSEISNLNTSVNSYMSSI